jgi:ATP-dependent Clp protease ATP-binding subunit ClpA
MSERKRIKLNTSVINPLEQEFRQFLESRIAGQPDAIDALGFAYRTGLNPIANPRRPRAVLIFAGPSRSGKSYSVECAAEFCHGSPDAMIELEGGELQLEHQVIKLTGAPPSYIGHKEAGEQKPGQELKPDPSAKLAPANLELSRNGSDCPLVWIRINEIEKAHSSLFDLLLGGTDNGKLNLGNNQVVNLGNCVIVMTSNLGMAELQRKPMGFLVREKTIKDVKSAVDEAVAGEFRPEFRNRIDDVVVFNPLSAKDIRRVVDFEVARLQERILAQVKRGQLFTIEVDEKAKDFILALADNSNGGVADMKRVFRKHLEGHLGNELLKGTINMGDKIVVTHEEGEKSLSFYLEEDGAIIGGADRLDVVDSPASHNTLIFQRQVDRAIYRAAHSPNSLYELSLVATSEREMFEEAAGLSHDVQEIFGMKVVAITYHREKPFTFKATVRGIEEQIKLLKSKWTEISIARKAEDEPARKSC